MFQITATTANPELSFMIQSCFISVNSNPEVASDYTLIENICPKDSSVKKYPMGVFPITRPQMERKRFSFTFSSKLNTSILFLHCEMSLCSRRNQNNKRLPVVGSEVLLKLLPTLNFKGISCFVLLQVQWFLDLQATEFLIFF